MGIIKKSENLEQKNKIVMEMRKNG